MAQHDFNINNQSAPAFRGDLNNALEALVTLSSGATAPATTYAGMIWHDTAANTLYIRSDADDAWIALGTLDQSLNTFTPAGVATQTTATWEAGTDTTESLVSAAKIAAAIASQVVTVNVATETAALSVGSIGTYALLKYNSSSPPTISAGGTTSGSNLRYAGAVTANYSGTSGPTATASGTPSGTWRIMGRLDMSGGVQVNNASLFLRIS